MVYEVEEEFLPTIGSLVGIDMGVNPKINIIRWLNYERKKVNKTKEKQLQQIISRAKRGSNSRKKKVKMLDLENYAVKNRNECHEITTNIVTIW